MATMLAYQRTEFVQLTGILNPLSFAQPMCPIDLRPMFENLGIKKSHYPAEIVR